MRILYFSTPSFADCDFPLVRQFQKMGHEVFFISLIFLVSLLVVHWLMLRSRYKKTGFSRHQGTRSLMLIGTICRLIRFM